jgi:hypothetical protein
MEVKGCATCYEGRSTFNHVIYQLLQQHNEIGVGRRINIRVWRFIFSNFLVRSRNFSRKIS